MIIFKIPNVVVEPRRSKKIADSDSDDEFFDRSGDVEKKRLKKSNTEQSAALSYEDLQLKEQETLEKISSLESKIEGYRLTEKMKKEKKPIEDDEDDLENFMSNLSNEKTLDKSDVRKLKVNTFLIKRHSKILNYTLI